MTGRLPAGKRVHKGQLLPAMDVLIIELCEDAQFFEAVAKAAPRMRPTFTGKVPCRG